MIGQATRKRASPSLSQDKAWCGKHLARGTPVWCVRDKATGLVIGYVAEDIAGVTHFDGVDVALFTVQRMVMRDGSAFFGPECAWPRRV